LDEINSLAMVYAFHAFICALVKIFMGLKVIRIKGKNMFLIHTKKKLPILIDSFKIKLKK
jgi:hypothetical protein